MTKTLMSIDYGTLTRRPLAIFRLVKGEVVATYRDQGYKRELLDTGIFTAAGTLYPEDGKAFFDGLEAAYGNTSHYALVVKKP